MKRQSCVFSACLLSNHRYHTPRRIRRKVGAFACTVDCEDQEGQVLYGKGWDYKKYRDVGMSDAEKVAWGGLTGEMLARTFSRNISDWVSIGLCICLCGCAHLQSSRDRVKQGGLRVQFCSDVCLRRFSQDLYGNVLELCTHVRVCARADALIGHTCIFVRVQRLDVKSRPMRTRSCSACIQESIHDPVLLHSRHVENLSLH